MNKPIPRRAGSPAPSRRQRGVAAIYAAVAMVAMLAALGLAIDVGNLYFSQRNLQKLASLAAIDAARVVSGCSGSEVVASSDDVTAAVTQSIANNGGDSEKLFKSGSTVVLGHYVDDPSTHQLSFEALPAGDGNIDAAQINLITPAPARFIPIPFVTATAMSTLKASAAAAQLPRGQLSAGGAAVMLNTSQATLLQAVPLLNNLLTALLGSNVSLTAVGYQGLANVSLPLDALGQAAGIDLTVADNLQQLLDLQVSLPGALNIVAGALNIVGTGADKVVATTVNGLAVAADPSRTLRFGDVLGIEGAIETVVTNVPFVDALDLILALGESANQGSDLDLPLGVTVPGVNFSTRIKIGEPPEFSPLGRPGCCNLDGTPFTYSRTAQITTTVRADFDLIQMIDNIPGVGGLLGGIVSLLGTDASGRIGLDVAVAPAKAQLDSIMCPRTGSAFPRVTLSSNQAVATLTVGAYTPPGNATPTPALEGGSLIDVTVLDLLGRPLAAVSIDLDPPAPTASVGSADLVTLPTYSDFTLTQKTSATDHTSYTAATPDVDDPYHACGNNANPCTIGSTDLLSSTVDSLIHDVVGSITVVTTPKVVGQIVTGVIDLLVSALEPILDLILDPLDAVLGELLQLLGLQVGTATVTMGSVTVDNPTVFSTTVPTTATP